LDDVKPFGGPSEAEGVRDSKEVLQLAKLHPAIITIRDRRHQKKLLAFDGLVNLTFA
jgi:hypothetical protein